MVYSSDWFLNERRQDRFPRQICEYITVGQTFRKGRLDAIADRFDPDHPGSGGDYYCNSAGYEMGWQYEKLKRRGDERDFSEMLWSGDIR